MSGRECNTDGTCVKPFKKYLRKRKNAPSTHTLTHSPSEQAPHTKITVYHWISAFLSLLAMVLLKVLTTARMKSASVGNLGPFRRWQGLPEYDPNPVSSILLAHWQCHSAAYSLSCQAQENPSNSALPRYTSKSSWKPAECIQGSGKHK